MAQAEATQSFADRILRDDLQSYLDQARQDPTNHLAPYQAGLIYSRLGEYGEALRSYQQAIERFPEFQQAYYNLGAAYGAVGRYAEAEQAYHKAIDLNRDDSEAWANLGAVHEALGRLDDALVSYGKAVELHPGELQASQRTARIHLSRGDYPQARAVCDALLQQHPESAEAWNDLGLVNFHMGDRHGAEGCYRRAIGLNDGYAQAWCNLGTVLLAEQDTLGAEQAYRRAVECDAKDPDIWFNLAEFLFQRGQVDAERCLWRTVELNRADLEAWDLLRRWYQGHRNPQRRLTVLRVLADARPEDAPLHLELAEAAEAQHELTQAQQAYAALLERNAQDQAAHLGLVRVFLKQGQVLEAFRHLGQVQAATPEVLDQWIHLGHRLRHRGRRAEAEACFAKALEHRPDEPELAWYLGELAMEREDWNEAFQWCERAGEVLRNDRHVWIPLMRRFYAAEDYRRAAACLDHLEELAQYLPGLWIEFDEVYGKAGRQDDLLLRLERWLELGLVPGAQWEQLAALYERAGRHDRADACRARTPPGGAGDEAGEATRQAVFLDDRQPSAELPVESDAAGDAPEADASGDPDRARQEVRESDVDHWIEQTDQYVRAGRMKEAMVSLRRAVAMDVPRYRAWFRIGGLFYAMGQLDQAEAAFQRATSLNEGEAKGWYNLGLCQAERGRHAPARKSFQQALRCNRRFAKAWDWLGLLHFHAGEHALARRCFVRCLAVGRNSANAWHNLGMLYRAMGREAESARCLSEAQRLGGVREQAGLTLPQPGTGASR